MVWSSYSYTQRYPVGVVCSDKGNKLGYDQECVNGYYMIMARKDGCYIERMDFSWFTAQIYRTWKSRRIEHVLNKRDSCPTIRRISCWWWGLRWWQCLGSKDNLLLGYFLPTENLNFFGSIANRKRQKRITSISRFKRI